MSQATRQSRSLLFLLFGSLVAARCLCWQFPSPLWTMGAVLGLTLLCGSTLSHLLSTGDALFPWSRIATRQFTYGELCAGLVGAVFVFVALVLPYARTVFS